MDQIELKKNSIIEIIYLCTIKVYVIELYMQYKHSTKWKIVKRI